LSSYGRKLNVVANYDNFNLAPAAADRYWEMVRHNTDNYFLSITRYSTNAFFRLQHLEHRIYRNFADAKEHLASSGQRFLSRVAGG
ncbi:MAG: hypothetical protein ABJC62_04475, partial [Frankiaceae bacterium]